MKNVVYVIEKNGQPLEYGGAGTIQAYHDLRWVEAWGQVTPIPRLQTERPVLYVSVETIRELLKEGAATGEGTSALKTFLELQEFRIPKTA